jgi:hypothetical protein
MKDQGLSLLACITDLEIYRSSPLVESSAMMGKTGSEGGYTDNSTQLMVVVKTDKYEIDSSVV